MKKSNLMPSVVLSCICITVALLLSAVNLVTGPKIKANQEAAANATLIEVLPDGKNFEEFAIDSTYPPVIEGAYKADGGYVFRANVKGYNPGLIILCGIDSDGKVAGVKHIASAETFGLEDELNGVYVGDTLDSVKLILATGATQKSNTSAAYYDAIKASLQAFAIANGADVDIRTPEQILQDNCNAALGTTDAVYTKWFRTEVIVGIDEVYSTDTNGGYVFVIGEKFVGINADGTLATADASKEDAQTASVAFEIISTAQTPEKLDVPEAFKKNVSEILLTASGNYIITAKGSGYGIYGEWHNSGERIDVKIAIDKDGKIGRAHV